MMKVFTQVCVEKINYLYFIWATRQVKNLKFKIWPRPLSCNVAFFIFCNKYALVIHNYTCRQNSTSVFQLGRGNGLFFRRLQDHCKFDLVFEGAVYLCFFQVVLDVPFFFRWIFHLIGLNLNVLLLNIFFMTRRCAFFDFQNFKAFIFLGSWKAFFGGGGGALDEEKKIKLKKTASFERREYAQE